MHIDRLEGLFIRISVVLLLVFAGAVLFAVFGLGVQLPGVVEQIAPEDVETTTGFDAPGVRQIYPGRYEVHMTAEAWQWTPTTITIPAGAEVTFFLASKDIIHGFKVDETNINIMVIPGQISEVTHTFETPGEYFFVCHEYCGSLHHTMSGVINVVEVEDS